ncbi:MAG: hypothetical protein L0H63_10440 [Nitrococcus sp.]|nr:hypothetical protein [Nitrococcus sp.]
MTGAQTAIADAGRCLSVGYIAARLLARETLACTDQDAGRNDYCLRVVLAW